MVAMRAIAMPRMTKPAGKKAHMTVVQIKVCGSSRRNGENASDKPLKNAGKKNVEGAPNFVAQKKARLNGRRKK